MVKTTDNRAQRKTGNSLNRETKHNMNLKRVLGFLFVHVCFFMTLCNAIQIDQAPQNSTVLVGDNVTLGCQISGKGSSDRVYWRRCSINSLQCDKASSTLISLDSVSVLDANKYSVVGTYNITIYNVSVAEEGLYQCETEVSSAITATAAAHLNVIAMPTNLTAYWSLPSPLKENVAVNATCVSVNSRPPATLRWYRGTTDITAQATTITSNATQNNGYGDTTSYISITPVVANHGQTYRCIATLSTNVTNETTLVESLENGAGHNTFVMLLMVFPTVLAFLLRG
ncbi:kin of IRRE-like protein 1 [Lingula anatina]|uniref:Kin of IRRE-like protein 1 n=1 Tax=Lingula anatina TaxID=7574 RepID=A0A1S3JSX0_LINAN|nr:kin of IRRE-like protein 1 [Lingula anatina]|eukprot:XP_013413221.1 kin of IRRE-like protein 1 [Lingula anatina]